METWLLVRKIPWRRKWQPTPVFLPGKSHGQRSLVGYSPWDHKTVRKVSATKQQQQNPCTMQCKQVCAQSLSRVQLFRDLTQDWNLCLLHWKAGSLLLSCQGSQYINNMK